MSKGEKRDRRPHVRIVEGSAAVATARGERRSSFGERNRIVLAVKPRAQSDRLKRCLDLVVASLLSLAAVPLFAIICILIRLDSPGPATYWRIRVGRNGRRFECLKLRSMYQDADARLNEILDADQELLREYAVYRKLRNDPRVTRVGRILRRFSLDELGQLWNVLKGEMSIVGPRPYDEAELCYMGGKDHIIQSVRPGMTGLWQISGRNRTSFSERLALDTQYVQNRSLWLDLRIFVRTIPAVLSSEGAY